MKAKHQPAAPALEQSTDLLGTERTGARLGAQIRRNLYAISGKPKVCPVCEDSACETKSEECGK